MNERGPRDGAAAYRADALRARPDVSAEQLAEHNVATAEHVMAAGEVYNLRH